MRYDMDEVVIERPRVRARYSYHDHRIRVSRYRNNPEALDDLPKNQGYRRPYRNDSKEFSDLLGPLRRFLESRVGQKWNDVYSEIRERINPSSTVQIHILGHVFQFVEINAWVGEDGGIYCDRGRWRNHHVPDGGLYVHPETGLLSMMPHQSRHYFRSRAYKAAVRKLFEIFGNHWPHRWGSVSETIEAAEDHLRIGQEQELHKIDGIWYWAVFEDVPPPFTDVWFDPTGRQHESEVRQPGTDFLTGVRVYEGRYRARKQQACRRDLRRYGLVNDFIKAV